MISVVFPDPVGPINAHAVPRFTLPSNGGMMRFSPIVTVRAVHVTGSVSSSPRGTAHIASQRTRPGLGQRPGKRCLSCVGALGFLFFLPCHNPILFRVTEGTPVDRRPQSGPFISAHAILQAEGTTPKKGSCPLAQCRWAFSRLELRRRMSEEQRRRLRLRCSALKSQCMRSACSRKRGFERFGLSLTVDAVLHAPEEGPTKAKGSGGQR